MAAAPESRNRSPAASADLSLVSDQFREASSRDVARPNAEALRDSSSRVLATGDAELRSFVLEVSAGRSAGVGDSPPPVATHVGDEPAADANDALRRPPDHDAVAPWALFDDQTEPVCEIPSPRPMFASVDVPVRRRSLPAWFASLSVHLTMLALLATVSFATLKPPSSLEMHFAPAAVEEVQFDEVAMEKVVEEIDGAVGALVAGDLPAELIDPGVGAFGGFSAETEFGSGWDAIGETGLAGTPGGGPLGDVGSMFGAGGEGQGTGEFGAGLGGAPTAKFFGAEIAGRRIVFVLDNSGSMQGGRLETVIAELLNCLDRLNEDQEFYIIFHSDAVYPMLYPDPIDRYVRPTKANKRLVAEWLDTVELCLGDSVEEAIMAAASIDPDTVFLLSDGRIQGENKFRVLLNGNSRNFPIHTFAVGMNGSVAGRKNLQMIADANGGSFTESEISPEMRDLSRRQMRPYHNKTPGPIWGRQVKSFKFGR